MNNSPEERIVLASGSAARCKMLRQVGLDIVVAASNLDESAIKTAAMAHNVPPRNLANQLAEAKATAVALDYRGNWIIGADQVLAVGKVLIDKAGNRKEARKTLEKLSGQSHELYTAVCVMRDATVLWRYLDTAILWMRPLSTDFIEGYLDRAGGEVLCSVGCYQIESLGAQLFDRVQGDHFTIQGMPLLPLLAFLRSQGLMPA